MANLPDINTADVGIIAFWNAHDHLSNGADTIDPTDCTGIFTSYSVYDNGLNGYIDPNAKGWGGSGRYINVRVKNDGWTIAWIDRTNTYFYPSKLSTDFGESEHKGYYDILWDWFQYSANINSSYSTLSNMLYRLYDALSNKASFGFASTDVGHYCYEFTNANVLTLLDHQVPSGSGTITAYVQHTTGTTIYYNAIASTVYGKTSHSANAYFADHQIAGTICDPSCVRYGTADILSENWSPDPQIDYDVDTYAAALGATAHSAILILWS